MPQRPEETKPACVGWQVSLNEQNNFVQLSAFVP